jgi:hypothetical protein
MYAGGGEVVSFRLSRLNPLDLGFRSAETTVPLDEITSRLRNKLMELMRIGKIKRDDAIQIDDDLDAIPNSSNKMVWEWVNTNAVTDIIKRMGYDSIILREGMQSHLGNVITYGILNKSKLTRIKS